MPRKNPNAAHDPRWRSAIEPAPGDLRIVQALVNTAGPSIESDLIATPKALREWLRYWQLIGEGDHLERGDLAKMRQLRSGLRALIRANQGADLEASIIEHLDRLASEATFGLRLSRQHEAGRVAWTSRQTSKGTGLREALGRIFMVLDFARRDGLWLRMKLCTDSSCRRAFYDRSKGQKAKWCSRNCGDKLSAKKYRNRRRQFRMARRRALGTSVRPRRRNVST